jgi:hypothetical protein
MADEVLPLPLPAAGSTCHCIYGFQVSAKRHPNCAGGPDAKSLVGGPTVPLTAAMKQGASR